MRTPAALATLLVAGIACIHDTRADRGPVPLGTLSCETRPELSLVFGLSPVAACEFAPADGGPRQAYAAMLARPAVRAEPAARSLRWEVVSDGPASAKSLDGTFAAGPGEAVLKGKAASLRPLPGPGRREPGLALATPRIELAAR